MDGARMRCLLVQVDALTRENNALALNDKKDGIRHQKYYYNNYYY